MAGLDRQCLFDLRRKVDEHSLHPHDQSGFQIEASHLSGTLDIFPSSEGREQK